MTNLIEFHIVEHCNLNCKGCIHFSPLANKSCTSVEEFEAEAQKTSEIFGNDVETVHLLGGEPLLHEDLTEILRIARDKFPTSEIKVISNGILLKKQDENFWLTLRKYNIVLSLTYYPIGIDYDEISNCAKKYGVGFSLYSSNKKDSQWHFPIDTEGKQDPFYNYNHCRLGNNCTNINIVDGKLYMCPISSNIRYFNKHFNKNVKLSKQDFLELNEIKNAKEVENFISKPIPFCKYCNVKDRSFNNKWEISKKDIYEWV